MLDDPKSARVKGVARLQQKDARLETGLFLLEGPQGLKELALRPQLAQEVFATEAALERYADLFDALEAHDVPIIEVSDRVLDKIADTATPQGVVAVVAQFDISLEQLIDSKPKLVAVLDRVQDPGNAGTVLRAADAAGADGVIFTSGSVDLYNPKTVRSTAGSILHVPAVIVVDAVAAATVLKNAGIQVFAASAGGELVTNLQQELVRPTAWIFGNEAQGVAESVINVADKTVALPIYGEAESLNLATAASVCLYASAFEQRRNR
ncbi:MAG: hypothetical protein RL068_633 [Actinomycetota bacterium]